MKSSRRAVKTMDSSTLRQAANDFQWYVDWRPDNPKRQRGDAFAGKPVPALTRCEKLISAARQTKPSAPPSLLCKGLQSGWGRRFRLPGQFFTPSDAWGYVECVNRRAAQ